MAPLSPHSKHCRNLKGSLEDVSNVWDRETKWLTQNAA